MFSFGTGFSSHSVIILTIRKKGLDSYATLNPSSPQSLNPNLLHSCQKETPFNDVGSDGHTCSAAVSSISMFTCSPAQEVVKFTLDSTLGA